MNTKSKTKDLEIINNLSINNDVLILSPMPKSINIDKIKEHITNYMEPRIKFYQDKNRSPYIEDEFSEYFTALASNGYQISSGNCAMDIITSNNEGIDVMCVIMNNNISNEKSLIQNFTSSGSNLDVLFTEQKDDDAIKLFMCDYMKKLEILKNYLIFIFVDIYIACLKINILRIPFITSGGFVKNKKNNFVNIILNNFIDTNIGKVTLYKSKKRVELRLKKEILQKNYIHKIYTIK